MLHFDLRISFVPFQRQENSLVSQHCGEKFVLFYREKFMLLLCNAVPKMKSSGEEEKVGIEVNIPLK